MNGPDQPDFDAMRYRNPMETDLVTRSFPNQRKVLNKG